jgi:hypothetical protein
MAKESPLGIFLFVSERIVTALLLVLFLKKNENIMIYKSPFGSLEELKYLE